MSELTTSDFDFELPEEAIARYPAERRDQSRLMVLDRKSGAISHHRFAELPELISPSTTMVFNDARVLPARLTGKKRDSGGKVELLLVEAIDGDPRRWRAMAGSSKPLRAGQQIELQPDVAVTVLAVEGEGFVAIELPEDGARLAARLGQLPLPPYLGRKAEALDDDRYQTVFSDPAAMRSVAAPTAGLHFTPQVLSQLDARGVRRVHVTLDVGPGTFLPVRVESLAEHVMHHERWFVSPEAAREIEAGRGQVLAVGTTVVRTLESQQDRVIAGTGSTALFIKPGFRFRVVDQLLTNFHLPRSTLLMLVAAFAGREQVLEAYRVAVAEGYRFFSYGDAMLLR